MHIAYIGLGSNLGDSRQILCRAVAQLATLGSVCVSKLYSTPPLGPQDQPDYLNAVVELQTTLGPLALLDALQSFEQKSGRVRLRHWGERTLDLDLLWYDGKNIQHERLTVPHVGLLDRDFVLMPLLDLNPDMSVNGSLLSMLKIVQHTQLKPIASADWATSST